MALLDAGQVKATFQLVTIGQAGRRSGGIGFDQPGAVTLSNVAVHKDELLWLVSAKPIYAADAMVNVAVPCWVQVTPSGEQYPVNVFPLRTSLTQ